MTDDAKADHASRRGGLQTGETLPVIGTFGGFSGARAVAKTLLKIVLNSRVRSLLQVNWYFDLLVNPNYRHTLFYLSKHPAEPISTANVARHVTAFKVDYPPETLIEEEYAVIQQKLSHEHLPQLDDDGIVDFDPQNEVVRFQPSSQIFIIFLRISQLIERLA